jgi:hypothetical protein
VLRLNELGWPREALAVNTAADDEPDEDDDLEPL